MDELISDDFELSADTEKEFMDSLPSGVCPECGKPVYQNPKGRAKKFCSQECRFAWKNKHPHPENWKMVTLICPVCGEEFKARGNGEVKRKYCSRACANHGRAIRSKAGDGDA